MILTSSLTEFPVLAHGRRLSDQESAARLRQGYRPLLQRLRRATSRLVVIQDVPHHRDDVPDCVAAHPDRLDACAIPRDKAVTATPLADVAHSLSRVTVIDPTPQLCRHQTCPGVIGNVLVYRNAGHLTATYAHTLDEWLGRRLPSLTEK